MQPPANITHLASLYVELNTTVDSLAMDPDILGQFTLRFNALGHSFTPQQMLRALFNARKNSQLPKIRK